MNHNGIVISGFDKTANMARPWADAGYLCYCVDIQHPKGERHEGNIIYVGADIRNWLPPRGRVVFAAFSPPCTHLAVSGARWFKGKGLRALAESIELFACAAELAENLDCPYSIENPVSTIASYWRKPDFTFDPCDFAGYLEDPTPEAYTKKTCLWTRGGSGDARKAPGRTRTRQQNASASTIGRPRQPALGHASWILPSHVLIQRLNPR